jgi:hypothetical protein
MTEIRLACAIAAGVFGGMSAWSLSFPPHGDSASATSALFQQAQFNTQQDAIKVSIVSHSLIDALPVTSKDIEPCGSHMNPCYVAISP